MNDDPVLLFTKPAMNNLNSPEAGSEDADFNREFLDYKESLQAVSDYAAFYLTAPKEATRMAEEAKNLHVSADRTCKKSANGQDYEKVQPVAGRNGKKR